MSDAVCRPYQSLQRCGDGENRIRLLILSPGECNDPIEITLRSYSIAQDLHYDGFCGTPTMVNGCPRQITHSLDTVLRYLRYKGCSCAMWIDALSIDQANIQERNHQVQLMHSIYSRATRMMTWLGPAKHESDLVIDYMLDNNDQLHLPRSLSHGPPLVFTSVGCARGCFDRRCTYPVRTPQPVVTLLVKSSS